MIKTASLRTPEGCLDAGAGGLEEYLSQIADGNREALAAIYRETSEAVYSYALSILKNTHDAQDVMQDCYLCISSAAHMYHSEGKPMAWILTIVRNLCLKNMRGRARTVSIAEEDRNFSLQEPAGLSAEDRMMLSACMNELGDEERQIVVLHAVSGLKHREIASLMELPLATVLSKYHRALKKLRNAWEKED